MSYGQCYKHAQAKNNKSTVIANSKIRQRQTLVGLKTRLRPLLG